MDLTTVATELCGLPLDRFTAARNEKAAEARAGGDRDLSAQIRQLAKPSAAAWVTNMLTRHRSDEIEGILELGASLRAAQEDLDARELRALSQQRSKLIAAVARQGRALADELGHPVSESAIREVEQTLQAAMADPAAATAVQSGCLVRALSSDGVTATDLTDALAIPASGQAPREPVSLDDRRKARQRKEAQRNLDEAERDLSRAVTAHDAVERKLAEAVPRREQLESELDELERRIAEVEAALATATQQTRSLERERDSAERALQDAEHDAERARQQLDRLG